MHHIKLGADHIGAPVRMLIHDLHVLVINRDTGDLAYVILRHGHLWHKEEICVPVTAVDHIADDIVYLNLDKAGVEALPVLPKY